MCGLTAVVLQPTIKTSSYKMPAHIVKLAEPVETQLTAAGCMLLIANEYEPSASVPICVSSSDTNSRVHDCTVQPCALAANCALMSVQNGACVLISEDGRVSGPPLGRFSTTVGNRALPCHADQNVMIASQKTVS